MTIKKHSLKNTGFTLIELLAVIVILAVIALIAVPAILNVIENARRGAAVDSAYGYIDAVDYSNSMSNLNSTDYSVITTGNISTINNLIKLDGTKPTDGNIVILNSKVTSANLCIDGYQIAYDGVKASITGNCEAVTYTLYANGTTVYFNPVTGETCNSAESVSTQGTNSGCMKWYTFLDSTNSSTVNMILDHNTTGAGILFSNTCETLDGPLDVISQIASDTSAWAGVPNRTDTYVFNGTYSDWSSTYNYTYNANYSSLKARVISADEIAEIIKATDFNVSTYTDNYLYFDTLTSNSPSTATNSYNFLFDNLTISSAYGTYTYNYWTSSASGNSKDFAWEVTKNEWGGSLQTNQVDASGSVGIRPVITLPKSLIE